MELLVPGALVEIVGLLEPALPVPEAEGVSPLNLNGQRAQLVSFDKGVKKWIATTFKGVDISVDPKFIRPLTGEDLKDYDFVFGPKSDFDTVASQLTDVLATKGYAVVRLFVADEEAEEVLSTTRRLEEESQFSRLAVEFERGYLGREGSAKTLLLDPSSSDAPSYVQRSALSMIDHNFGAFSQMLAPYTEDALGFDIYSRTNLLLSLPLTEGEEDSYPPADIDDTDVEGYFHTMARKKLSVLQFVGPQTNQLRLVPVGSSGGEEIELQTEPHTVLLVVASRFEYAYEPSEGSLTLTSFFLAEPAVYQIYGQVGGDLEVLGVGSGPQAPPGEQIIVAGMYCRYGGNSDGRFHLWTAVGKAATDGLSDIPFSRWDNSEYYDPEQRPGCTYTKHGCFGIEGVDLFDCKFFEISPMEAKGMDPCQRQVMEVSYMALLEGGWDKRSLARDSQNIGHFVGIDKDDWMLMGAAGMLKFEGAHAAAGAANAITSNRFSYSLNLKGASMTIDTACSSSLVCTHVAKLHLRYKDNEPMPAAIVNGLNLMLFAGPFIGCCGAGMLSHEGRCFTFNATADGYARGELCGAACFKPAPFTSDGSVLACLAGSQANQDGRSASLTAPNGPAQEKCIKAVLRECSLTPSDVDIFECHGTGTALGDPIEVGSFRKVMSATPRPDPLVITSSKSNIAHGEGGAGFAGFCKCVLQVSHCEGASNLHFKFINPHLDIAGFPCHILSEALALKGESAYAGVSSFGFGGTNAHAEAWGKNIMTSRSSLFQDNTMKFQRKLAQAPPAEITMNGDDVKEWETTGLDPRAEPNSRWKISLDEDGVIEWERDDGDDDAPDFGDEFFLRGTHTGWEPEAMERHHSIPNLWTCMVTLGDSGLEQFQVMGDSDEEKIFHPGQPMCTMKSAAICGPSGSTKDNAWLIRGEPNDTFTVEFFQQGRQLSIMWMKC